MVRKTLRSIGNILVKEQNEVLSIAALLMIVGLVTKFFGVVVSAFIAREFGTNLETFNIAAVIPDAITTIVLAGAISSSIIPIFSKVSTTEDESEFRKSFSNVFNVILLLCLVLALGVAIFTKEVIPVAISISGTKANFTDFEIASIVDMSRILLISQVLLISSTFLSTWLNIKQRFLIPQVAPLFYNFGKLFGVLVLVPLFSGSVWGLVWGMVLGGVLHLVIQIPVLKYLGFSWDVFYVNFKDRNLLDAVRLGLPRTISLGIEQLAVIVDSIIAVGLSTIVISALSVYKYSVQVMQLPLSLGVSFAVAAFPSFAKLKAQNNHEEFSKLFFRVINEVLYMTIPVSVILIVLRVPVVRLMFGLMDGKFDWDSTLMVAACVMFFAFGTPFESLRGIMFRAYFAARDSVTPFISSILVLSGGVISGILFTNYFSNLDGVHLGSFVFNLNYFFTKGDGQFGIAGLALSSSLVFTLEFVFLLFMLNRKGFLIGTKDFIKGLFVKLFIALVMLLTCYGLAKFWESILDTAMTLQLIVLTGSTIMASLSVYLLLSYIFSVDEVRIFLKLLKKILKLFKIDIEN